MALWRALMPTEYVTSIYTIDLERLWRMGKRIILCDLDNTLVPWNHPWVPKSLQTWLDEAHQRGFHVCIVSNNRSQRVSDFSRVSGLPAVGAARKPKSAGFQKALAKFEMTADQAVMIGDQLFTDIQGANRLGLYTILVLPIHKQEWWGTRVVRSLERIVMAGLFLRGLKRPQASKRGGTEHGF